MSDRSLKLFDGVTHIDDDLVEGAMAYRPPLRRRYRRVAAALAALAAVLAAAFLLRLPMRGGLTSGNSAPTTPSMGFDAESTLPTVGGGDDAAPRDPLPSSPTVSDPSAPPEELLPSDPVGDTPRDAVFIEILPLTVDDADGLEASREVTIDLASVDGGEVIVDDSFLMMNCLPVDVTFTAAYPCEKSAEPSVTVDGADTPCLALESFNGESAADGAAYLVFDVTVPANSGVTVAARSFFTGSPDGLWNVAVGTECASPLAFTSQRARVLGLDAFDVLSQDFGFGGGAEFFELDAGKSRYVLTVRRRE